MLSVEARQTIEAVIREELAGEPISAVLFGTWPDENYDDMVQVIVLVDKSGQINPKKTVGLVGKIRQRLRQADHAVFPVLSFVKRSEFRKPRPEAA